MYNFYMELLKFYGNGKSVFYLLNINNCLVVEIVLFVLIDCI